MIALADMIPVRPVRIGDNPGLAWAEGLTLSLPRPFLEASGLAAGLDSRGDLRLPDGLALPGAAEVAAAVRECRAFPGQRPVSSRLPFSYHVLPAVVRQFVAKAMGRRLRGRQGHWARFPLWPLDLGADFLADLAGPDASARPAGPTPVVLSHDLDSAEGLANVVELFLPLEEAHGARSMNFVVPRAWPLDEGLLGEIAARGHGLGIHGHDHGNTTWLLDGPARRHRLEQSRDLARRHGMAGYRAPSLLRSRELLRDVAACYRFDSSIPTSGGPFPVPNNGCATARPFALEGLLEIPLSLPRDGSLLFLGHAPGEILALWQATAAAIARSGGVVVLLTHCEQRFSGNAPMLAAYTAFLDHLATSDAYRFVRMDALAGREKGPRPA